MYSSSYAIAAPAVVWLTTHLGSSLINDFLEPFVGTPPSPLDTFSAMWALGKPSMASRTAGSVFLYELRDLKRMFDLLPGKHTSFNAWASLLKYLNAGHLNWNFGWRPFISDIRKIAKQLASFETRLNKFVSQQNSLMLRHVGQPEASTEDTVWTTSAYDAHVQFERIVKATTKLCGTFQYSYTLPQYDYQTFRYRALADALGLKLDPATIWAVIPWSFVVDYFYNLGNFLEQFGSDWIEPWVTYCQGCHSVKRSVEVEVWVHLRKAIPSYYRKALAAKLTSSTYTRVTGWPSVGAPLAGELTLDKIRLMASLGISKIL